MPKASGTPYALWLMPQQEHKVLFSEIIKELAMAFGTTEFEPHVTWGSGSWPGDIDDLKGLMAKLCDNSTNPSLQSDGMDGKNRLLNYLYLRLHDSSQSLFDQPKEFIKGCKAPIVGPHLSVMYCDRPGIMCRATLSQSIEKRLPTTIEFDRIRLVSPKTGDWKNIDSWECLHEIQLSS